MAKMGRPEKSYEDSLVRRINVGLRPVTRGRVEAIANSTGRSLSAVVREAILKYLDAQTA